MQLFSWHGQLLSSKWCMPERVWFAPQTKNSGELQLMRELLWRKDLQYLTDQLSPADGSVCERFFAPGKSLIHYKFYYPLHSGSFRVFKAPLTFFITTHYWCQIHIQTSHFMWKRLSHYASGWLKTTKNSCNYWRCRIPCCAHYHWIDKINIWFC